MTKTRPLDALYTEEPPLGTIAGDGRPPKEKQPMHGSNSSHAQLSSSRSLSNTIIITTGICYDLGQYHTDTVGWGMLTFQR